MSLDGGRGVQPKPGVRFDSFQTWTELVKAYLIWPNLLMLNLFSNRFGHERFSSAWALPSEPTPIKEAQAWTEPTNRL